MKTRSSFVSNSSSSSFILSDDPAMKPVTVDVIREFILQSIPNYRKLCRQFTNLENVFDAEAHDPYPLFCVFDLKDPIQRKEAIVTLEDCLSGWNNLTSLMDSDGTVKRNSSARCNSDTFDSIEEECENYIDPDGYSPGYKCYSYSEFIKHKDDGMTKIESTDPNDTRPIPEFLLDRLNSYKSQLKVCDAFETMLAPNASIVIHFDENTIWNIKSLTVENPEEYDTKAYTCDRFCEVFANWLIANLKVTPDFHWRTIRNSIIHFNLHEG